MSKDSINLLELYFKGSDNGWNDFLTAALKARDVKRLAKVRRALQVGMDDLTKQKLDNEKIHVFFVRLTKSIEDTLRAILRDKYPNPLDDPRFDRATAEKRWLEIKRKRDHEFELFLRKASF
jgi:hypothetical protein